ncbi:cell division protein FtsQ/DivIB [Arthrobacter sp. Hor0625]|uniref:cell division protein FtsQ/DivIB n=1 Tax=Arthrobacter sp. Hor0625 TaxID=3457358 RepID=UPI00403E7485
MPSTRRPGYPTGPRATGPARPAGSGDEVISASKADPGPGAPGASTPSAVPGASSNEPRGNVLAFPEPRAKRRRRLVLGTLAALLALVAAIVAAAVYSPWLAVHSVTVEGTRMLKPDQVKAALAPLQGKPLPQVSDEEVTRLLRPLVQVKAVSTQARPPSTLQVRITERVPVALVKQAATYQLVDVDGVQLSTTKTPDKVKLPVIDGGRGTLPKDLFHAITAVLGALPPDVLARLSDASAKSADAVELKLIDGQTVVWGNAGERELKARVLAALLKVPADPKNPVAVYDVSVPRHPVTR